MRARVHGGLGQLRFDFIVKILDPFPTKLKVSLFCLLIQCELVLISRQQLLESFVLILVNQC